jgi:gliding motility-associated-like protein
VATEAELVYATAENFAFPNVFSPNSDGENDIFAPQSNNVFRSSDVSVTLIDITIFDKQGRKVHAYSGSMRDWQGWDGRIMNSNREAPEGVYFYAISFLGAWEDKINPVGNKVLKGFFHLYRQ